MGILRAVNNPVIPATPPSGGDVVLLGDAVVGDGSEASGVYTITARGSADPDDGSWWPLQTIAAGSNCQITWRMPTVLTGATLTDYAGAGVQFRSDVTTGKLCMNWWPVIGLMRYKYRDTAAGATTGGIFGTSAAALPYYGAMVYDNTYPRVQFWESSVGGVDPADWSLVATQSIDLSAGFDAGLYVVGVQANAVTVTAVIDNVNIATQLTLLESTTVPVDPPAPPDPNSATYGTGKDLTYNDAWRATSDIVLGWDWSMPANATPYTLGGIFHSGSTTKPAYFQGNVLKHLIRDWSDVEAVENTYDFSSITDDAATFVAAGWDGCILQFRGFVTEVLNSAGDPHPTKQSLVTAPTWTFGYATVQENLHGSGVQVRQLDIDNAAVRSRFLDLITAFGAEGIPANANIKAAVLHGLSNSQGEEWTGYQAGQAATVVQMQEYIAAWVAAYGANASKLAWMNERPIELYNEAAITGGTGMRGGAIETWLMNKYTDHVGEVTSFQSGQIYNATNGHLTWEEGCLPMSENRHWMDENESSGVYSSGPEPRWHYRAANLRMLQMRRNLAWTITNYTLDPRMDNYLSVTLGKIVSTTKDAWVWLMQSQALIAGTHPLPINNFERWLMQYETDGATTPSNRVLWGKNVTGDPRHVSADWYTDMCRTGLSIGITVATSFITGGRSVAVKVTYFDVGTGQWTLEYDTGAGIGTGQGVVNLDGTGELRTVTFFLADFHANGGAAKSFTLDDASAAVPFAFVRVIKV